MKTDSISDSKRCSNFEDKAIMKQLYIGVMSGTSLDGIDVTLCQISESRCTLLHSFEYAFDKELKKEILHLISSKTTLKQIGMLHSKLGHQFAKVINKFIKTYSIDISKVQAIGLHGQTLWHEPNSQYPFSMQLGCPNVVSAKTGIKVVSDFRSMDIANGGQGAPFAPAFHRFVFSSLGKKSAVVNIGGMSNITLLEKELKGWDCGPGNVLMDVWAQIALKKSYDKDGKFARRGKVHRELLDDILSQSYFHKEPPKSCGREQFNKKYLLERVSKYPDIKTQDVQRTLLELTAKIIAKDVKEFGVKKLVVCGGGSKNRALMKRLAKLSKIEVVRSDALGVSSDFLESMAFAWLAYKRLHGEVVELKSVTGASKNSLLGGIYG